MKDVLLAIALVSNLIGGKPAPENQYPEIIYIRSAHGRCSATIISDEVILTAAHCVVDNGKISSAIPKLEFTAKCKQAPMYRDKIQDHDMALCKVDAPFDVKPASISKTGPQIDDKALLTGYGCIKKGGGGGNDGILRIGYSKVVRLSPTKYSWFMTQNDAALCFGDSGGPSMLAGTKEHFVIGVNSKGNIKDLSLLTATYTNDSIKFMEDFAKEQEVDICGVTRECL